MKYLELGYVLPAVCADVAASRAIEILEHVADSDPGLLFYVIQASNILALSGLRAISPYNDFEPNFTRSKRVKLAELLHEHGYEILLEEDPYSNETKSIFSILCLDRLADIPEQYTAVKSFWRTPLKPSDYPDFVLWSTSMQGALADSMSKNELPKEWLEDGWAQHNIRFGMLLGYPGEAIATYCWDQAEQNSGLKTADTLTASIPFQGIYSGAHINYVYSSTIEDLSTINAHTALWSEVLKKVYQVFSEERLKQYPEFIEKYARYKIYDEN